MLLFFRNKVIPIFFRQMFVQFFIVFFSQNQSEKESTSITNDETSSNSDGKASDKDTEPAQQKVEVNLPDPLPSYIIKIDTPAPKGFSFLTIFKLVFVTKIIFLRFITVFIIKSIFFLHYTLSQFQQQQWLVKFKKKLSSTKMNLAKNLKLLNFLKHYFLHLRNISTLNSLKSRLLVFEKVKYLNYQLKVSVNWQ